MPSMDCRCGLTASPALANTKQEETLTCTGCKTALSNKPSRAALSWHSLMEVTVEVRQAAVKSFA